MENIEILDSCTDIHDERNIQYSEVVWSISDIPSSYFIDYREFQNQAAEWYPYWCVFFSQSMWENEMNFIEWSTVRSTWKELCDYALKQGLFDPKSWAMIISGPKVGVALGYLNWYAQVTTLDEIKHSIANNRPVQVWSNQIDWKPIIVQEGTWGGHSIHFVGYDDQTQLLKIKESYGPNKWDWWYQYLRYSDLWLLFPSKFSLIDKKDPLITNYKQKIMDGINIPAAKTAFENWFWNGLNPTQPVTREEAATMVERCFEKLSAQLQK